MNGCMFLIVLFFMPETLFDRPENEPLVEDMSDLKEKIEEHENNDAGTTPRGSLSFKQLVYNVQSVIHIPYRFIKKHLHRKRISQITWLIGQRNPPSP